jgi:hypothetical protein
MYQKETTEINYSAENLIWINTKQMFGDLHPDNLV